MLSTGDIDNNVHPANTYRLADALIKANKRFDFVVLPGDAPRLPADRRTSSGCEPITSRGRCSAQSADSVDMVELNREKEQSGDKKKKATSPQ